MKDYHHFTPGPTDMQENGGIFTGKLDQERFGNET